MSQELTQLVWSNFPGKGSELLVLMGIAEVCNSLGNCHPHIEQLATSTRLSSSTVFVAIKALRRGRWIVTDRVTGQGGTLIFQINTQKLARSRRTNR